MFPQMTDENLNCKLELKPASAALVPVTRSGHLPLRCVNISIQISAHKPTASHSSVYSWQLNVKYSSTETSEKLVWKNLPALKGSIHVAENNSLQAAIDSASNGNTVYIESGSYMEHLNINKTISLIATGGSARTHIFGDVSITAQNVTLEGMTFYSSINSFSTITIYNSSVFILNCQFVDSIRSRALYTPIPTVAIDCDNCTNLQIVNNDFVGWKNAVLLKITQNPVIQTNTFRSCHTGLSIVAGSDMIVTGNLFTHNIIALKFPMPTQTDQLLQTNYFSDNVIPLIYNGKVILYPELQANYQFSHHVQVTQRLFATGLCNMEVHANLSHDACLSIGHSEFLSHGM